MTVTSSTRELDETRGVVRVEDLYDTDIADLWDACTRPERLARWIARVDGDDLRQGGTVQAVFTSSWSGAVHIESCEAPRHLRPALRRRHRRGDRRRGVADRRG